MTDRLEELLDGQWEDEEREGQAVLPSGSQGRPRLRGRHRGRKDAEDREIQGEGRPAPLAGLGAEGVAGPETGAQSTAVRTRDTQTPWGRALGGLLPWADGGATGAPGWGVGLALPAAGALDGAEDAPREERAPLELERARAVARYPQGTLVRAPREREERENTQWRGGPVLEDGLSRLGRAAAYAARPSAPPERGRAQGMPRAAQWQGGGDRTVWAVDRAIERDARRYDGKFAFY